MAPRARIAAYKALLVHRDGRTASGYTSDLVAAIDQAVADGVDVINYSISGTTTNFRDPVEIAFLYAADAGVFVAASAGNSGPTAGTVAHPSPWITTVAAARTTGARVGSVHARQRRDLHRRLGRGPAVVTAPLIDSIAAGAAGADPTAVSLCYSAATNGGTPRSTRPRWPARSWSATAASNARVDKSLAVQEAGGVGMILLNPASNSLNADFHSVPTVHLQNTDLRAGARRMRPRQAQRRPSRPGDASTSRRRRPSRRSFSSRGPLPRERRPAQAGRDRSRPGHPGGGLAEDNGGLDFDLYSGTSMSSPHVAGLARAAQGPAPGLDADDDQVGADDHGLDVLDGPNTNPLVIFRQGAGHVRPNSAADPGLVFDSGWNDWLGFLCGTQLPATFCTSSGIAVLDPSDFNDAVHRHRRPARRADRDAHGDQRRRQGHLQRLGVRARRARRERLPVLLHAQSRPEAGAPDHHPPASRLR